MTNKNTSAPDHTTTTVQILWGDSPGKAVPSIWQDMHIVQQNRTLQKVCHSRRSRMVNRMEQGVSQEYKEDDIEMVVSIQYA